MDDMTLTYDEIETLIAFIKNHERNEIPNCVWDLCMKMCDFCNGTQPPIMMVGILE